MTAFPPAVDGVRELITSIPMPAGFEPSWAGAAPGGGFAFGSEDGLGLVTDVNGRVVRHPGLVNLSREAVNGMAFLPPWTAVSTRNEVTVTSEEHKTIATVPAGAHDVVAGSGCFFAPLGRQGLLSDIPTHGDKNLYTIHRGPGDHSFFYRVISLRPPGGRELVACAMRRGGVAAAEFRGGTFHDYNTLSFDNLDVVGVCALRPGEPSTSAAALGIDGTLILFEDVLGGPSPVTVRYPVITGTAYRVLSARGLLFVLTSHALYGILGLIEPGLNGDARMTPIFALPLEAVDMFLAGDRWLLIILPDGVLRLDIELLAEMKPADLQRFERRDVTPTRLDPVWTEKAVSLVAAAV
ncbi:MAG: hypothetical protein ACRC33_18575 [Gemmataceae bacterium]